MNRMAQVSLSVFRCLVGIACWNVASMISAGEPIRVAVFEGEGVGPSVEDLVSALKSRDGHGLTLQRISADEIRAGQLSDMNVLVHPGGSGSRQGKTLGEEGRAVVKRFIKDGGGFLGVCGGCYLATNDDSWSQNLIDAKCLDRLHWTRGSGSVMVKLSPRCRDVLGRSP